MDKVVSIVSHRRFKSKLKENTPAISPNAMMLGFVVITVLMTVIISLLGVSDWHDAVAITAVVGLIAFFKIVLADLVFIALLKADEIEDPRLAAMRPPEPPRPADRRLVPLRPQIVNARAVPAVHDRIRVAANAGGRR